MSKDNQGCLETSFFSLIQIQNDAQNPNPNVTPIKLILCTEDCYSSLQSFSLPLKISEECGSLVAAKTEHILTCFIMHMDFLAA